MGVWDGVMVLVWKGDVVKREEKLRPAAALLPPSPPTNETHKPQTAYTQWGTTEVL